MAQKDVSELKKQDLIFKIRQKSGTYSSYLNYEIKIPGSDSGWLG
jgi:hypothetical protein